MAVECKVISRPKAKDPRATGIKTVGPKGKALKCSNCGRNRKSGTALCDTCTAKMKVK